MDNPYYFYQDPRLPLQPSLVLATIKVNDSEARKALNQNLGMLNSRFESPSLKIVQIVKKSLPALVPIENNENVTVIHIGGEPTPKAGPSSKSPNIEIIELDSPPKEKSNSFSDENPLVIDLDVPEEVNIESSEEDFDETEFNELIDYFKK